MTEDENRALFFQAVAHQQAGRHADAERDYRALLARNPRVAAAHNNLGMLLDTQARYDEAEQCFRAALAVKPANPEALNNLGAVLRQNHQYDEALRCFRQALDLTPDNVEALINLADTLRELRLLDEVQALYVRAQALRPGDFRVHKGLGRLFAERGQPDLAIAALARAAALSPQDLDLRSDLVTQRLTACDWAEFADDEKAIIEGVRAGKPGVNPFLAVSLETTVADQYACAVRYAQTSGFKGIPRAFVPRAADRKVRLGYMSSDFREHPISYLIVEHLSLFDRVRFDVIGYSSGGNDYSSMRRRVEGAVDIFVDLEALSDSAAADRIEEDNIDILVEVSGYTKHSRPRILAFRPAPLQVSFLAFPGTMGTDFIDYLIGDQFVIPRAQQVFYSEKIVYMPASYQVNDSHRKIAEDVATRTALGLPAAAFVFCCFNRSYKITPAFFDIWMRLLRRVPGSVLWLLATNPVATANLRREAETRGVDANRLVFAPRVPLAEHLARHAHADLFLDTLPYGAHTTMSDALWAGLPAVTCASDTFAGRVGGSLLCAVGLPDLVTSTRQDYEDLAFNLATNRTRLDDLRKRLQNGLATTPLFDCARYTRNIESAYERMVRLHDSGRPPEGMTI